jgi:type III secretion protein D
MPIALEYPKGGVLKIKGIAATDADRLTALQRLAAQQNDIPIAAVEILSTAEVQSALMRAARDAALPAVALTWNAGVLAVKANHFNATQRNHLTSLITALNKRYLNVFTLEQEDAQAVAMNIPFRIHSIIGGPQPWLILENGTKLVVGGTYDNYRLKSIEDSRVIFEAENSTAGVSTAIITR